MALVFRGLGRDEYYNGPIVTSGLGIVLVADIEEIRKKCGVTRMRLMADRRAEEDRKLIEALTSDKIKDQKKLAARYTPNAAESLFKNRRDAIMRLRKKSPITIKEEKKVIAVQAEQAVTVEPTKPAMADDEMAMLMMMASVQAGFTAMVVAHGK